ATAAAAIGRLDILKFLHGIGGSMEGGAQVSPACNAAQGGYLEIIQWLDTIIDLTQDDNVNSPQHAASNGHLHILKWWHQRGHPTDINGCGIGAADGQHREVLKWCTERRGITSEPWILAILAKRGNLELIKWLRNDFGFEWNETVTESASENGHLELL